jgi:anti-sigma B factor antagonist
VDDFRCMAEWAGDSSAVVTVQGALDLHTTSRLADVLNNLKRRGMSDHLVVDLSRCTFMDSVGLGALVRAQKRLAKSPLHVVTGDGVARILELARLNDVFVLHTTRAEAVAALGRLTRQT